ncbi:MAG: hypothetical protein ABIO94_08715, partial [Opitutaceae bacterium]
MDRASRGLMNGSSAWIGFTLFGLALVAYWPALRGAFIWDDNGHITPPELRSLGGLFRIWFEIGATQQYYPVLHSVFWLEHRAFGDVAIGYHVVNVLLHATAAWLFAMVLRRLHAPGAWLAAFLFLVHPVEVESVAWISEQKNTLSLVFYLLAALAYLRFDQDRRPAQYRNAGYELDSSGVGLGVGRPHRGLRGLGEPSLPVVPRQSPNLTSRRYYVLATVLFLLALGSKTVSASLPAALLVVFWWQRGRL